MFLSDPATTCSATNAARPQPILSYRPIYDHAAQCSRQRCRHRHRLRRGHRDGPRHRYRGCPWHRSGRSFRSRSRCSGRTGHPQCIHRRPALNRPSRPPRSDRHADRRAGSRLDRCNALVRAARERRVVEVGPTLDPGDKMSSNYCIGGEYPPTVSSSLRSGHPDPAGGPDFCGRERPPVARMNRRCVS